MPIVTMSHTLIVQPLPPYSLAGWCVVIGAVPAHTLYEWFNLIIFMRLVSRLLIFRKSMREIYGFCSLDKMDK